MERARFAAAVFRTVHLTILSRLERCGRLVDPRYQFTVRRNGHIMSSDTFDVTEIRFACTITDLYDFNYEDGNLPACAAAAQIGYGAGTVSERAAHGKIFSHEIEIEAIFSDPFEFYTTIEGN